MGDRWGAAFVRIGWQASFGLGGSFAPDWVAGITGIRTAKASAPPVPWFVLCLWLQKGILENMAWFKPFDFYALSWDILRKPA